MGSFCLKVRQFGRRHQNHDPIKKKKTHFKLPILTKIQRDAYQKHGQKKKH